MTASSWTLMKITRQHKPTIGRHTDKRNIYAGIHDTTSDVFNLMSHSNHGRSALVVIPAVSYSSSAMSKRSENFAENNTSGKAKLESCTIAMITEHSDTDQTRDTECQSIELFSQSSRISARTNPSDREGRNLMLTMMTAKNRPKCKDPQV